MDNNLKWIFNNNTVNAAYFSNELIYPTNENVTVNVIGPLTGFEVSLYDVVLSKLQTKETSKYTRLEYIESTGNQYIDTGFKPNQDTRVITDFQMLEDATSKFVYGARNASYYESFGFLITTATKNFRATYENIKSMDFDVDLLNRHIVDQNKNTTTLDDVVKSTTISNFLSKYNLFLFSCNEADTVKYKSKCRIYSCKIYDNDTLIRDYVPVKNDKGIAGLYDKVNSVFYTSTEAFIEGPEIGIVLFKPTATYKIKRDTSYMIKASDVEGYITPEKQSFTAKNYSRTVDVIYEELPVIDLSMFDIYGNPILLNTANCYVVNKADTYKIPLVFGNALKNGAVNSAAYTKNSGSYSHDFVDFNGTVITSPYIENVSGKADSAQLSIADTDGIFTDISIVDGSPCRYLQFKVNSVPDTGANGVLSIKNSSGVIMWSWHIWIWPYDLTPVEINNTTGVVYNILPVNLATKLDTADSINKTTGWKNWFYQFGRPTPLLCPSAYNSTNDHASYGALNYSTTSSTLHLYKGIQNPTTFFKYSSAYYNWFDTYSGKAYNLWDADCTSTGNSDNNVVKTIYDPCPIGFKMPNGNTFTYFLTSNVVGSFANGYKFKRYSGDTVGVFFPALGYRSYSDGSLVGVDLLGYVWLSSAKSLIYCYSLIFNSVNIVPQNTAYRAHGFSVRPVQDMCTYGQNKRTKIRIDQTITDPEAMITRIVDLGGIEAIRANSHRYTGTFADEVMTLKQLDDNDGTKYVDGTTATLTIIGTDVWMKLPQFHWKCSQYATDVWDFEVVYGVKPDDTYKTWDGNDLIGVYEACISSNEMCSVSNKISTGSVSQNNFKTFARARGEGFTLVKWKHHCMMAMLYYTQYGNTDCQKIIGHGNDSYEKTTGKTNSLGMTDTVYGDNGSINSINFWGLENWWGNKYEWIDNVTVNGGFWYITEDDGTVRQPYLNNAYGGWTTNLLFGENLDMIPTSFRGSDSSGYCDYCTVSPNKDLCAVSRSCSYSSNSGGVASIDASSSYSYTNSTYGSRLAFRGNIVIES